MKLRHSPSSPFVRKVMVAAAETGNGDRIEIIPTNTRDPNSDLAKDNPLAKIPALITDGGEKLYDSAVICEYLDSLHDGARLLPPAGEARWRALRLQALGDGILDASVLCMIESRLPANERSPTLVAMQKGKIASAVDALEKEAADFGDDITLGAIAIGCALGYLDFRSLGDDWRFGHPTLSAWYAGFSKRPSMIGSAPRERA